MDGAPLHQHVPGREVHAGAPLCLTAPARSRRARLVETDGVAGRKRTLPPEQFEICEARTHRGMRKVLLFSKDILVAEWLKTRSPAGQEQGLDCLARS